MLKTQNLIILPSSNILYTRQWTRGYNKGRLYNFLLWLFNFFMFVDKSIKDVVW